ncbi:MAG TPA: ANTAR domain-containing protein [Actinocrinis sp.]|uniref:ANTAR domain-containing response regulator n=1 Tax=Actinocrinis sp. TaxID=1920516 RepID=UPI002D22A795|nr:ANTAR domain-containing protein [Actinocrinis sp.]HZU58499.1 ANTAR domain-containing protein [Actinocrinis sp.]
MYGIEQFDHAPTQVDEIVAAARAVASTLEQLARSLGRGAVPGADGPDGSPERWEALCEENRQLREALDSRSAIERAKGILMGRFGYDEQEAFALLVTTARRRHRKVRMIASELLMGACFPEIEQSVVAQAVYRSDPAATVSDIV